MAAISKIGHLVLGCETHSKECSSRTVHAYVCPPFLILDKAQNYCLPSLEILFSFVPNKKAEEVLRVKLYIFLFDKRLHLR